MTEEIIQTKVKTFLEKMYGNSNLEFNFSSGWFKRFKSRREIKS